jgi:hypothetical protein
LTVVSGGLAIKDWGGDKLLPPTVVYFVVFVLILIASEGFHQVDLRKETFFIEPEVVIKKEEFEERVKEGE